jgi:hypothetical protein
MAAIQKDSKSLDYPNTWSGQPNACIEETDGQLKYIFSD